MNSYRAKRLPAELGANLAGGGPCIELACPVVLLLVLWWPVAAAWADGPDELFRPGSKLRIVVDKVMQPVAGWTAQEWMVCAAAEAGFNVYCPRKGHDRFDEVRRVAQWCKKYGIYYMPWMRGSLAVSLDDPQARGKRMLWASGNEQPLWSPNSDELWQWIEHHVIYYAKLSAENPHLVGVFFDFENYAPGREANLYDLSYDDQILSEFGTAIGREIPLLAPAQRKAWLEKQGLYEQFAKFQIDRWRSRCRRLRQMVDQYNPKFRFCVYPAPGTPFIVQAIYPEWSSKQAPLILADACTYGRPGYLVPQDRALAKNRQRLLQRRQVPEQAGIAFLYIGGIDPAVQGADPEFCGKNAVMIAEATDGYWIFYEGPDYKTTHPEYWKWFTWANRAIASGNFEVWHEPRETAEQWSLKIFVGRLPRVNTALLRPIEQMVDLPLVRFRGEHLLVLKPASAQQVQLKLRDVPVGQYQSDLVWEVRDQHGKRIAGDVIPHGTSGWVRFSAGDAEYYWLGITSGSCSWTVERTNTTWAVVAGSGIHLIGHAERLYFPVANAGRGFTLNLETAGRETALVKLLEPSGEVFGQIETTPAQPRVSLVVSPTESCAGVWAFSVGRATTGVLEDVSIRLTGGRIDWLVPRADWVMSLR